MLTKQELDCLIESMETWVNKDLSGDIMGAIFTGMIGRDDPLSKAKMAEEERLRKIKADAERKIRKERCIVIQAKLLAMRDSVDADKLTASV